MRHLAFALVLALSSLACKTQGIAHLPPPDSFYYPAGIAFVSDGSPNGVLYVASANLDRRFDFGSVIAVPLSTLGLTRAGLPPVSATLPAAPHEIHTLNLDPGGANQVLIGSYAGEMGLWHLASGGVRLFVPSRAENSLLHIIDAGAGNSPLTSLACEVGASPTDCSSGVPSSIANQTARGDLARFRAPQPYGVGISASGSGSGQVFITHLLGADFPVGSTQNIQSFVVRFNPDPPPTPDQFTDPSLFLPIGADPSNSVAVGDRYAFVTGRFNSPQGTLVRLVDRTTGVVNNPGVESRFQALESRGIALTTKPASSNDQRMFVLTRSPDALLVVDVLNPSADTPSLTVLRSVPLPPGPNQIRVIERPASGSVGVAKGPLAIITCTNDLPNTDPFGGAVVVYDDDLGALASQVIVGTQPYGLAMDLDSAHRRARVYASNFGDGRISVLDLASWDQPQNFFLVAHVGLPQVCLVTPSDPMCAEIP